MYDPHAHLHIRSGEYDKADDVAENADGTDDESEPVVGNKVDLVQSSLMIRDPRCIVHCSVTPQLPLKIMYCRLRQETALVFTDVWLSLMFSAGKLSDKKTTINTFWNEVLSERKPQ